MKEKIYQRQLSKLGLNNALFLDEEASETDAKFTPEDLKKIFELDPDTDCQTHDLSNCSCQSKLNSTEKQDQDGQEEGHSSGWVHVSPLDTKKKSDWAAQDPLMSLTFQQSLYSTGVSFVFNKNTAF